MDPYMYRNIEFDCWNDMRKEAKLYNVYINDYNFKVNCAEHWIIVSTHTHAHQHTFHVNHPSKLTHFIFIYTLNTPYTLLYMYVLPYPSSSRRRVICFPGGRQVQGGIAERNGDVYVPRSKYLQR